MYDIIDTVKSCGLSKEGRINLMKNKIIAILMCAAVWGTVLAGCNTDTGTTPPAEAETAASDEAQDKAETPDEGQAEATEEAKAPDDGANPYLAKAEELSKSGLADRFALIDVDGDDTPELAAVSSEGSWEKDQVFIYTVKDGDVILLTSDIAPGMEGHRVGFYKGLNLIECSGAASGERHDFYTVKDGKLEAVLSLMSFDDPDKDFETLYLVDDKETDEDTFIKTAKDFLSSYKNMTVLDIEAMSEATTDFSDGYENLVVNGTIPYLSLEELENAAP